VAVYLRYLRAKRAASRAQVIGICRFSYPALGGFKTEHETPEARARFLYAPERLDERFRLFEAFTLPSLRAQKDQDFTFLVVTGDDLPKDRMDQLRDLTRDIPQVRITPLPPGIHRHVLRDAINAVRDRNRWTIQFRHDDDDAINVGFIRECRRILRDHYKLFQQNGHGIIDFTRGYNARGSVEGILAEPANTLFLGVAYAIIFRPGQHLTVMNFFHHRAWEHLQAIVRTDPDMWVRGVNDHNDSREPLGRKAELLSPQDEARFQKAFGISSDRVREIWRR
jgi:hypothetical protein